MAAQIPVYRHPTMTVLIDDDRTSLVTLQYQIDTSLATTTFNRARNALAWIVECFNKVVQLGDASASRVDAQSEAIVAVGGADEALEQIYHYVGKPERFLLPTVVVIDYSMPDMDGLEFCVAAHDLPCKKILFTAQADDKTAIDGFNRGLINKFIRKQDPDALDRLEAAIDVLQADYFLERSRAVAARLDVRDFGFLSDAVVANLVRKLRDTYGFVEHYLFAYPTGLLFFDAGGHATLLVIQTQDSLDAHVKAALAHGATTEDVAPLTDGRAVPFFHSTDGMWNAQLPGQLGEYIKAAQRCLGDEDYLWALFELPLHYQKSMPYSHAQFLREHIAARA